MTINRLRLYGSTNILEVYTTGIQGASGSTLLSGPTAPTALDGVEGDYFFVTGDPAQIYGPKTATGWPTEPFFSQNQYTKRYVHTQNVASAVWDVNHNLGGQPSVTVVDSANTVVVGDVQYIDDSNIQITFTGAFSGTVYLT